MKRIILCILLLAFTCPAMAQQAIKKSGNPDKPKEIITTEKLFKKTSDELLYEANVTPKYEKYLECLSYNTQRLDDNISDAKTIAEGVADTCLNFYLRYTLAEINHLNDFIKDSQKKIPLNFDDEIKHNIRYALGYVLNHRAKIRSKKKD